MIGFYAAGAMGSGSVPPLEQTLWSPENKAADIVLTNGNRDAYSTTGAGGGIVLSVSGKTSGKFYAEVERIQNYTPDHTAGPGLHRETSGLTTYLGSTANGWGVYSASSGNGSRTFNNATAANIDTGSGTSAIGQRFRIAADLDNGRLYLAISNRNSGAWIGGGDPALGSSPTYTFTPGGDTFYLAACPLRGDFTNPKNWLRLVLPASWSFSPPAGFGIWT